MSLTPRSLLFLPATRADRFEKALASGADLVILDLEDAVPPAEKDKGLATALDLLRAHGGVAGDRIAVRVNDSTTDRGRADLAALADPKLALAAVLLPKAGSAQDVVGAAGALEAMGRRARLIPLIETALGLAHCEAIAVASDRIVALMLGGVDLTAELGATLEWDALLYARSRIVHAAALAGLATVDTPSLEVTDFAAVGREAGAVARLGFTGKAAIHPAQLPPIHAAFTPDEEDVERARRILKAFDDSKGGPVLVDGKMVDPPVVKSAQRTLARAGRPR